MAKTQYPEAKPGEIWAQADGCTVVNLAPGTWAAFLTNLPVYEDDVEFQHPMKLFVDQSGTVKLDKLTYPNGSVFGAAS